MGSMTDLQSEGWKNSPSKRSVVPYTISAAVAETSSFNAVRILKSTRKGRASTQEAGLG